jgi:hypothetical protein
VSHAASDGIITALRRPNPAQSVVGSRFTSLNLDADGHLVMAMVKVKVMGW